MADTKITNLTSAAASTGDELVVSTTAATDRKVTAESVANLARQLTQAVTVGGVLTLTTGNIAFPAVQITNAGANVLDDYEEGGFSPTWTPVTTGTYTNGYAAANTGNYVKIGSMVYVGGLLSVTTHTSGTGTGQMGIGMPFASRADGAGTINIVNASSTYRGVRSAILTTAAAIARAYLGPIATTGATSALNLADLSTAAQSFSFSGVYSV